MTWLTYSIIALAAFSVYDLLSRYLGVQSKNPRAFSGVYNIFALLFVPILLFVEPIRFPTLTIVLIGLTSCGLLAWALFGRFEYFAHKHVEASTLTIILKLGPVITFILSILFLGETLSFYKILGLILTILASLLVVGMPTRSQMKKNSGLWYGFLITGILGLAWTFDKVLTPLYGIVLFCYISYAAMALAAIFFPFVGWSDLKSELRLGSWKVIVLAFINVIGYGAMIKALTLGEASRVIPISISTTPFVVLGAFFLLKERKDAWKKFGATILVIIAIYFMR